MTWPYSTFLFSCFVISIVAFNSKHLNMRTHLSNSLQNLLSKILQEQLTVIQEKVLSNYKSNNATLNNKIMEKLFEELMQQIPEEIVLPNFKVDDQIPGYNIKLYLCTTSTAVSNLSNYIIDNVNITMSNTNVPISLETWFIFPSWSFAGNYEVDVNTPDIHIFGVGPFSVFFHNTKLYTRSSFSVTSRNHLNMTDFSTDISIDRSEVNFENMFNDSSATEAVNALMSVAIPKALNEFHENIQTFVKNLVIPLANLFFTFFSIPELIIFLNDLIR